ncbi:MAG: glycosyltransferase [Candidatus Eisenbacteria bacterium]|nr:glycosyltransferase [Candidatus Eisenbacteria bacterium]
MCPSPIVNRDMKVLHIDTEPTWRGGEQQALLLARGLLRRGVETSVLGQPGSPLLARTRQERIPSHAIAMHSEADLGAVYRIVRLLSRERPGIIHMHTSHAHALGVAAAKLTGIGRTVVSRRVDFSIHRAPLRLGLLKYRLGVDRIIAISRAVREVLVRDGIPAERVELVPSGVDLQELDATPRIDFHRELSIPRGAPVVGNVAHFGWHKAQEELVKAAPLIWERFPEARIVLVGDGSCRPKVERTAREVGADGRLIFTGYRADARALIRWFDAFAICSVLEGLCTSIMDAHALGTPVAATRVGGIPELVRHRETGLLVPPRDPSALAAAIGALLHDPDLGRRMSLAGRALVERSFSAETMVGGTLDVYSRVLQQVEADHRGV